MGGDRQHGLKTMQAVIRFSSGCWGVYGNQMMEPAFIYHACSSYSRAMQHGDGRCATIQAPDQHE